LESWVGSNGHLVCICRKKAIQLVTAWFSM
jgi:hypothetical protein